MREQERAAPLLGLLCSAGFGCRRARAVPKQGAAAFPALQRRSRALHKPSPVPPPQNPSYNTVMKLVFLGTSSAIIYYMRFHRTIRLT